MPRFLRRLLDRLPSDLPLQVRTDKDAYAPGETVEVSVSAGPAKKKVRFDHVAITLETQIEYEYDTLSGNDGTRRRTLTERGIAAEQRFTEAQTLARDERAEWSASLAVPEDLPGTSLGEIVKVRWLADALVPFRRSVDAHADRPVQVYAPLARYSRLASRQPDLDTDGKADLTLELPERHARPGEKLSGTLRIHALERLEAKEIRVELIRHEHVPIDYEADSWGFEARNELSGETALEPGQDVELPFTLDVPATVAPTLDIPQGSIEWSVVGTVSRSLRGDLTVGQVITIYDDPRPADELPESPDGSTDKHEGIEDVFAQLPGDEPRDASAPGTP